MKNKKLVRIGVVGEHSVAVVVNDYITSHFYENVIQVIVKESLEDPNRFAIWVLVEWESQF